MAIEPSAQTEDWLGYGQYADSLWARMLLALSPPWEKGDSARQPIISRPGADPLVVGVYGEWGVGKSKLLELVYDRAVAENAKRLHQRSQDPEAWAKSPALSVVVPVWFHPWRYENEPSLAVPLLMHVTEALQATLKQANSTTEALRRDIAELAVAGVEDAKLLTKLFNGAKKAVQVAGKVAGNEMVKATAGAAAAMVGAKQLADSALEWVEETAERFADDNGDEDSEKDDAGKRADKIKPEDPRPVASSDGRYHYNVHKYLRELSHVTPKLAKRHQQTLKADVHLRFAVFIDDLDRCLPENAVAVLELIKTLLNVESFAFMVALDDEVIERGISHRYRDYRFKGAKPEMPITGFEYLEKIVHLPFRLPALTRVQALAFLRAQEDRLFADAAMPPGCVRLWFMARPTRELTGLASSTAPAGSPPPAQPNEMDATPLTDMLLDSFEVYVPRKLLRALELMHQWQSVLARRGTPLQAGETAPLLLAMALLQLFAPDVFRLLRRRPGMWREWMNAHLTLEAEFQPVFSALRRPVAPHFELQASDALLFRWVAQGAKAGWHPPKTVVSQDPTQEKTMAEWNGDLPVWRAALADFLGTEPATLHSAEQVRLPLVLALCEYREAQRHAFNPMLMSAALVHNLRWETTTQVADPAPYWRLLNREAISAGAELASSGVASASGTGTLAEVTIDAPSAKTRYDLNISKLLAVVSSSDASTRSTVVEALGLAPGDVLPAPALEQIAQATVSLVPVQALTLWAQLAPHVRAAELPAALQSRWPEGLLETADDATRKLLAPSFQVLHRHALLREFNLERPFEMLRQQLAVQRDDEKLDLTQRELAAIAVAELGDSRFDFDANRWHLPSRRALVLDGMGRRETAPHEEPIIGFVLLPAVTFTRGEKDVGDNPPHSVHVSSFYMARTLTTVAQWAAFIKAGGYDDEALWRPDPQGLRWRQGLLDSEVENEAYKGWLSRRPAEHRQQPWRWDDQQTMPSHPVWGINWFEARAYARWLQRQLAPELAEARLQAWQVRLPTEDQYERAARASSATEVHAEHWPWGDDAKLAPVRANVDETGLGHATPVGLFAPNPLGLYDLTGNLGEWQDNLFGGEASKGTWPRVKNEQGLLTDKELEKCEMPSIRGGSWGSSSVSAQCAIRGRHQPVSYLNQVGLRVVLSLVEDDS